MLRVSGKNLFLLKGAAIRSVRGKPLLTMAVRSNASSVKSSPAPKSAGQRGRLLLALGALAIGSSIFSIGYRKNPPVAFDEPAQKPVDQPAFSSNDVSVIFVLGGPGAGKGTQCDRLVREYGFVHLSAGDLLRAEQARENSEYGELIKHHIKEGLIVPQEITIALLKNAIQDAFAQGNKRFLVDGFPRKMDQAISFERQIVKSKFTLYFECPEEVMLKRLLERGKTSGRSDDNLESIRKRFKVFLDTSMPVIEHFAAQDKVVKVRCDQGVDDVFKQVQASIKERIAEVN